MKTLFHSALAFGALLLFGSNAAWGENASIITLADKPVRIIRGASVYKAVNGVLVQKDDIVETDAVGAQIEAGPNAIVAMGPNTKLFWAGLTTDGQSMNELVVLQGWVKLLINESKQGSKQGGKRTVVSAPAIRVSLDAGASIIRSARDKGEMFVEQGNQLVAKVDDKGKFGADTKVANDQFAFTNAGSAIQILSRPSKDFLKEMPVAFRDPVARAPASNKLSKLPATKERDVDYADISVWLTSNLHVKKNFVNRFSSRLSDATFRKQLDLELGQTNEWKTVMQLHTIGKSDMAVAKPSATYGATEGWYVNPEVPVAKPEVSVAKPQASTVKQHASTPKPDAQKPLHKFVDY